MRSQIAIAFIFVFMPILTVAQSRIGRTESFVCPERSLTTSSSVICCDTLGSSSCEETLEKTLTRKQIDFLGALTVTVLNFPKNKDWAPNCFATSMVLADQPVAQPFQYSSDWEFVNNLEQFYEQLSDDEERKPGDILVFEEQGEIFRRLEDEMGRKSFKWRPYEQLAHAMYYLGNDLVVQKENAMTAVSSVSSIKRAFERYSWGLEQSQRTATAVYTKKKTFLALKTYRLKSQVNRGQQSTF